MSRMRIEKTQLRRLNVGFKRVICAQELLRANLPQWYENRDPMQPRMQELLESGTIMPLRKLDDQGRMVILARLVHNPLKFSFEEALQISTMVLDVAIKDHVSSSLYGCVIIIDMGYVTFRHLTQVRPRHLMNMTHSWQGCYPLRIKSINCINVLEIATPALMLGKYFLNNKLKQRVHFYTHKTTPDCFANIPDDILPVEYGGTDGTIQELIDYWKKVIEENRDWFIDDDRYKPVL
ncbi:retinol-binding protein pinta-like isoform X3 [Anoplolepis gracilipes]|uniref:retinol-binding protein pinta-like isoform X3 n=1 Tax=Anoplolepis gracilipes TaxID=354296 RepID=UPI003B9E8E01